MTKLTGYTENTTPALTDILMLVDDPGGSPLTQYTKVKNLTPYFVGTTNVNWAGTQGLALTSTSWDGDARSTTAKTGLDLSAVFGAPAGIKAVMFNVLMADSGSAAGEAYIVIGPTNTADKGSWFSCTGLANNAVARGQIVSSCNVNGDVYFQIVATGAGSMILHLQIVGYWL